MKPVFVLIWFIAGFGVAYGQQCDNDEVKNPIQLYI